jgi:hypothetical protein
MAGIGLLITTGVSVTANVSGETDPIAKLAHAWPVIAYLFGELIANRVRAFAARKAAEKAAEKAAAELAEKAALAAAIAIQTAAISAPANVAELESPDLPAAPVSPAIPSAPAPAKSTGKRSQYGPRNGDEYSERHARRLASGK